MLSFDVPLGVNVFDKQRIAELDINVFAHRIPFAIFTSYIIQLCWVYILRERQIHSLARL